MRDEIILKGINRVRDVLSGPDGYIYVSLNTKGPNYGELYRIKPAH